MGGKKKTKWRKLPLEDFTKELPPKPEEQPPIDSCQAGVTREENDFIPSCNGPSEIIQNYVEPYEYIDGIWYPTSCVVYNPGLYSNYVMPADTCYYYCTMPEAGQLQEYMPVPYQEYTPALPKDTVYLLLPTQTFRPTQPVQNVTPEWQNRRRRRRYEGYAEYAEIPEKTSSLKTEEKDHCRVSGTHANSKRKSAQFNNFRRMSSFSETSSSDGLALEQNQISRKLSERKKDNETESSYVNEGMDLLSSENVYTPRKGPEMCGVHSRNKTATKVQQTGNGKINTVTVYDESHIAADMYHTNIENTKAPTEELHSVICMPVSSSQPGNLLASRIASENTKNKNMQNEKSDAMNNTDLITNEISEQATSLSSTSQEREINEKISYLKLKDDRLQKVAMKNKTRVEDTLKTDSKASLPDILSSLNKITNEKIKEPGNSCGSHLCQNEDLNKESPKSKPLSTQTNYAQNLPISDAMHNEMEMELKELKSLTVIQPDQSIYKLAYDEIDTDQSETSTSSSRSQSPVNPESQIPGSYHVDEIVVFEADTDVEVEDRSEDVELIPHRYESESYLNKIQNKNVFENKLSLAVELLRTQEDLPYDCEFKRIVDENNVEPSVQSKGKVNSSFRKSSCSPEKDSLTKNIGNKCQYNGKNMKEISSQRQINPSPDNSSDSAIFSDSSFIDANNLENETRDPANDVVFQGNENQENTNEIREGYRRFGIQARRRFSPLPFNPCFCCILM